MFIEKQKETLFSVLSPEKCYDLKWREWTAGGQRCAAAYLASLTDSAELNKAVAFLLGETDFPETPEEAALRFPSGDITILTQKNDFANEILKGHPVFFFDAFPEALAADFKSFPVRGVDEPQKSRTLRGPHVGFNENMASSLALIRRYLRTSSLSAELFSPGSEAKNDLALLYLEGRADEAHLERLRKRLKEIRLPALSMTQDTLVNALFPRKGAMLLNPLPLVRFTERPDVVAATLLEGKIALLCDNTPSVILLPESVFDFFEEADDYYFPPVTASYLRLVRGLVFFASVFLVPTWLLFAKHQEVLPAGLNFVVQHEEMAVPLFLQCLIIEVALDGLRMASLNTPDPLANSFSVVGGLLLGDFAVKSGWFIPQTILYSAFTAIANFVPANYELGYSFKFMRISLILLVQLFDLWGLIGGVLFWIAVLIFTKTSAGKRYLYPFFPPDLKGMRKLFFKGTSGKERSFSGGSGRKGERAGKTNEKR